QPLRSDLDGGSAGRVGHRTGLDVSGAIHGPGRADAVCEHPGTAAVLNRGHGADARKRNHGACSKATRSPARMRAGGSDAGLKLTNRVLPITGQPVGMEVAAIAVCRAANSTLPGGTVCRTVSRRGTSMTSSCS